MNSFLKAGLLTLALVAAPIAAQAGTLEGVAIGAGAGAVVAGPPGAVVGGVIGAVTGGRISFAAAIVIAGPAATAIVTVAAKAIICPIGIDDPVTMTERATRSAPFAFEPSSKPPSV